jgi:ATP-binding cassette, subfamily C (CFTR/MRP), member 1
VSVPSSVRSFCPHSPPCRAAQYDDEAIWRALGQVNMATTVRAMSQGLQEQITENGENLSQGQRQLLCIARALLRNARVLIMDEATSAVDQHTDDLIQTVLREEAHERGTTVLTIAHRLHTIADFDKILVLGSGEVLEYDSPAALLSRDSEFSRMLNDYHSLHANSPPSQRRSSESSLA